MIAWGLGGAAGLGILSLGIYAATRPGKEPLDRKAEKAKVRELGERVEALGILPGFADFLVATARIESRFNPDAGSSAGFPNNSARGYFGHRPGSAMNAKNGLSKLRKSHPNLLKNREWSVALAADYARRVIPRADPGQVIEFQDLRRAWKFPGNIADSAVTDAGTARSRRQFLNAATKTGVPLSMLTRTVELGDWPGILPLVEALGGAMP